jgi:hypothetical protein
MVRSLARQALPAVSGAFVACTLLQVFLAGLGVFDDPGAFVTHREFGYLIGWFTLAILVLALLGRESRTIVGLSVVLVVQFALQSVLVGLRTSQPAVAALHPVNGLLIVVVAIAVTRLAWAARRELRPGAQEAVETAEADPAVGATRAAGADLSQAVGRPR